MAPAWVTSAATLTRAQGLFSGNPRSKCQVDKDGLRNLTVEKLAEGLQSRPGNEMAGLEGRAQLLIRLGHALENRDYFGQGRPGFMLGKQIRLPLAENFVRAVLTRQTTCSRTPQRTPRRRPWCPCPSSGTLS